VLARTGWRKKLRAHTCTQTTIKETMHRDENKVLKKHDLHEGVEEIGEGRINARSGPD
jgi:hypothetical protein